MPPVVAGAALAGAAAAGTAAITAGTVFAATVATAFVTTFATTAILGGLSMALAPKPKKADVMQAARGIQQMVRSTIESRKIIYGEAMVSGPLAFVGSTGENNKYIHLVIPLAGHEVESIGDVYFNDTLSTDARFTGKYRIKKHLGTAGQAADADLVAEVAEWTTNHRLRGVAYLYVRLEWDRDVWPTGLPNIKAIVKGKKVFDPRTGTTSWSDNWALCTRDYLTSAQGLSASLDEIDDTSFIAGANACDELTEKPGGGTQKRYTVNGVVDTADRPIDIMQSLGTAAAGAVVYTQGVYKCHPGIYVSPSASLNEDSLRGGISVQPRISRRELYNGVKGTFIDPAKEWLPSDFPPVKNATYAGQDGEEIIRDIDLPFTTDSARSQRIAKIHLEKSRQGITLKYPATFAAFSIAVMDVVQISIDRLGWANKEFRCLDWELAPDGQGVDLLLQEESSTSYSWSGTDGLAVDPAPDTNLANPFLLAAPTNLIVDSQTLILADGTPVTVLNASWTAPFGEYLDHYEIQWRESGTVNWQSGRTVGTETNFTTSIALPGNDYDVRVRAVNAIGVRSAWTSIGATAEGKDTPPSELTALTATGGIFEINWQWTFPNEKDIDYVELVVSSSNDRSLASSLTDAKFPRRSHKQTGLAAGASFFAWGRVWDTSGNFSDWYPASSTNGINGQSSSDANEILSYLAGQIATSHLVQSLNTRIDLIDGPDTLSGSVNKRIQDTKAILDADITTLQAEVAELSGTPEWSVDDSYITGDLVKFDGGLYSALQDITAPGPDPTNASYWEKIGDFASLGEAVTAHAAQLTDHETRITDSEGDITAQASQITVLQTTVNDPNDGVTANANAIDSLDTRVTTAEGTITTHTSDITALESTVDNPTTGVNANATAISSLDTRVTTAEGDISTNSSDIVSLEITVNHPSTGVSANAGAISVLDGRVDIAEGNISINASDITSLESTVTNLDGDVAANATAISSLDTRVTTAEGTITTQSSDITGLENTVNDPNTGVNANSSAITSLDSRVTTAEGTISTHSSDITSLQSSITGFDDDISANATAITSLDTRVTSVEGDVTAQASDITQLQTNVNGNTSTIETHTTSIDGLEGQFTVKVDINDRVTGFGFASSARDATPFSEFVVKADRFAIVDPATPAETPTIPFVVQGGQTFINQALIGTGWINNAMIGNIIQASALASDGQPTWKLDKTGAIDARSITIRDTTGTVILQSGGNLDYARVGGTKPPSDATKGADSTNLAAGTSANQIANSDFSLGLDGWSLFTSHSGELSRNFGSDWIVGRGTAYIFQPSNDSTGISIASTPSGAGHFPVISGNYYEASIYTGAQRCNSYIEIKWLDSNNTEIGQTQGTSNNEEAGGGSTLASYKRLHVIAQAPASATRARLQLIKQGTKSGDSSFLFFTRALFSEARAAQTVPSPWSASPPLLDQMTASNISTYIASAAIGNAQIGNAAVGTLTIAGEAVTVARHYTNDAKVSLIWDSDAESGWSAWVDLAASSIDTAGAATSLWFDYYGFCAGSVQGTDSGQFIVEIGIFRDSTQIKSIHWVNITFISGGVSGSDSIVPVSYRDASPGTGTKNYKLRIRAYKDTTANVQYSVAWRSMMLIGTKR